MSGVREGNVSVSNKLPGKLSVLLKLLVRFQRLGETVMNSPCFGNVDPGNITYLVNGHG